MKSNLLNEYLTKIAQRVDWLVTTCSVSYPNMAAKELAREHLNKEIHAILLEVYEVGFVAGKKEQVSLHTKRYKIDKFKMEKELRIRIKKELLESVTKEYRIQDERIKKNLIKKAMQDEIDVEESN